MVLACVAFVCVATGAIGVMNVLLISVREQRREIGLLKAIGATSRQVALLFLWKRRRMQRWAGCWGFSSAWG
ncbi:MAG: FtsX-like permease family protein [Christensenellales bacterium]